MKNKFFVACCIVLLLFVPGCAPSTATQALVPMETTEAASATPQAETYTSNGKMLEGTWEYECDELGFNRYTWTSELHFDHANMIVKIRFDDWDTMWDSPLAFVIYSSKPGYEYNWLYTKPDGTLDPELTYFDEYGPMEVYPGGYAAFEKELNAMEIDWASMYSKTKTEFLLMYLIDLDQNNQCGQNKTEPELDTNSL